MHCCFGHVMNKKMVLNKYGTIAQEQWHWLIERYPYIISHQFVVMPNHIHALIEINRDVIFTGAISGSGHDLNLLPPIKIKSLSELIGAYKTTTSKQIHLLGYHEFKWQRSFHDHIVRDARAFENMKNYIINNPAKWDR